MSWALSLPKPSAASLRPGVPPPDFVRQVALFRIQNRDGWGVGLTIPAALGNLLPVLPEEESVALLEAFDRQRQVDLAARLVSFDARSLGAGVDRHAGAGTIARGRRFPCLPSAGRGRAAVRRVGQYRRGPAYPHRCRPLSRCPFAYGTCRTPNGRNRPAAHARR